METLPRIWETRVSGRWAAVLGFRSITRRGRSWQLLSLVQPEPAGGGCQEVLVPQNQEAGSSTLKSSHFNIQCCFNIRVPSSASLFYLWVSFTVK